MNLVKCRKKLHDYDRDVHNQCPECKKIQCNRNAKLRYNLDKTKEQNRKLKRHYGIDLIEYKALLHTQDYRCAICHEPSSNFSYRLAVDHCHSTGKIRGILCRPCNQAIGLLKDDPTLLSNAANYLTK